MNPEIYIIAGIVLGLLFTELTGLSPGGIIVPSYMAMFLNRPVEIILTVAAAVLIMFLVKLVSKYFYLFGRRRYVLCLLLGLTLKLAIEYFFPNLPLPDNTGIKLIGWLIPGILANDMNKQGIPSTLLGTGAVTALVFLFMQGWTVLGLS